MVARLRFWHDGASPMVLMSGRGVLLHEGRRVVRQPQKWGEKELMGGAHREGASTVAAPILVAPVYLLRPASNKKQKGEGGARVCPTWKKGGGEKGDGDAHDPFF
jgi:hypothetical protein